VYGTQWGFFLFVYLPGSTEWHGGQSTAGTELCLAVSLVWCFLSPLSSTN